MIHATLAMLASVLNSEFLGGDTVFEGVSIDTRTLKKGNLFVAIQGDHLDGHDFISQAEQQGAAAVVVNSRSKTNLPQLVVSDTRLALGHIAQFWRSQFTLPIVGITGSCGKTTTKQMVAAILSQRGFTLMSEGNQNNYFGVPLTLFQLNKNHRYAVIEMGADRPGEISYLTNIVKPTVAIITNVSPSHLEVREGVGFGSVEGIFKEKSQIFSKLPHNGTAIINSDDAFFQEWKRSLGAQPYRSFGLSETADVYPSKLVHDEEMHYSFDINTPAGSIPITLSILGYHNVANALAAATAALILNIDLVSIQKGLAETLSAKRRMQHYYTKQGARVIDDSYNANPRSVAAVLEMLSRYKGKRIMIFGDMLELGSISTEQHSKIGEYARQLGIEYLYAYGRQSIHAVNAFGEGGQHFENKEKLVSSLRSHLNSEVTIMVKGSRGMHMEAIVDALVTGE